LTEGGGGFLTEGGGGFLTEGGGGFLTEGGGGFLTQGGGVEQSSDMANATADPPTELSATQGRRSVTLNWTAPDFGQVRRYDIWRAEGSFPTRALVVINSSLFSLIKTLTGAPPSTTFTDTNVKNNTTYTYFLTQTNKQGVKSDISEPETIFVKP
jgi:hypothetical protein